MGRPLGLYRKEQNLNSYYGYFFISVAYRSPLVIIMVDVSPNIFTSILKKWDAPIIGEL